MRFGCRLVSQQPPDSPLARIGVASRPRPQNAKALCEQELTPDEKSEVVASCDHLAKLKYSKALPTAFT